MNSVQILGNLARDPEVRFTKTGRAVATFTVAATNTYVDSTTNETKEQTAFINVVAWGKLGEAAGNLRKGSRCFVEGRLQIRSFDGKDGQKRWVSEIVAQSVEFLDRRSSTATTVESPIPHDAAAQFGQDVAPDDEIPF